MISQRFKYTKLLAVSTLGASSAIIAGAFGFPAAVFVALVAVILPIAIIHLLDGPVESKDATNWNWNGHLVQSQKMALLGQVSAGIAHEINNPLAIISQEAQLASIALGREEARGLNCKEVIAGSLGEIEKQVARGSEIVVKFLNFARESKIVCQLVNVNGLVEDMIQLTRKDRTRTAFEIVSNLESRLPQVNTDPALIRQVILNVLHNAVQAIDEDGIIRVTTLRNPSGGITVEIADNGPGIAPGDIDRVFDPFFTTRPPGQGTGLGLAICMMIMERLGGRISARNGPGRGAVFSVFIPGTASYDS